MSITAKRGLTDSGIVNGKAMAWPPIKTELVARNILVSLFPSRIRKYEKRFSGGSESGKIQIQC